MHLLQCVAFYYIHCFCLIMWPRYTDRYTICIMDPEGSCNNFSSDKSKVYSFGCNFPDLLRSDQRRSWQDGMQNKCTCFQLIRQPVLVAQTFEYTYGYVYCPWAYGRGNEESEDQKMWLVIYSLAAQTFIINTGWLWNFCPKDFMIIIKKKLFYRCARESNILQNLRLSVSKQNCWFVCMFPK